MKTDILKFGMTFVIIAALMWCSGSRALGVMLQFSLDGMNPAPEEIVVSPGDIIPMNVVSYTSGENYIRVIEIVSPANGPVIIENVVALPEAGDLASVVDQTYPVYGHPDLVSYAFILYAKDSQGGIIAGTHFAFDVRIDGDALTGETRYLYFKSPLLPDDIVAFNIVPEPASAFIMGVGLALLRIGGRRK